MIRSWREVAGIATLTRRSDTTHANNVCAHVPMPNSSGNVPDNLEQKLIADSYPAGIILAWLKEVTWTC